MSRGPGNEEAASFGEHSVLQGFLAGPHFELPVGLEIAELRELPTLAPAQHPAVAKFSANPERYSCSFVLKELEKSQLVKDLSCAV